MGSNRGAVEGKNWKMQVFWTVLTYKLSKGLVMFIVFLQISWAKSSHFNRKDWEFHLKAKDLSVQILQLVQSHKFGALTNKKLLCLKATSLWAMLHTVQHNRQWTFFVFTFTVFWGESMRLKILHGGVKFPHADFATHSYLSHRLDTFPNRNLTGLKWLLCELCFKNATLLTMMDNQFCQ